MKNLTSSGDHDKISKVIEMLIKEFAKSPQANHRKVSQFLEYCLAFALLRSECFQFSFVKLFSSLGFFFCIGWSNWLSCCNCWFIYRSCSISWGITVNYSNVCTITHSYSADSMIWKVMFSVILSMYKSIYGISVLYFLVYRMFSNFSFRFMACEANSATCD